MPEYIIRKIRLAHCKRGPEICEKCRQMDQERICLLDISPPDAGMVQRRVIQVRIEGEDTWREFKIDKVFENELEARQYALDKNITDIDL